MIWEFRESMSERASPEGNSGELLFEAYSTSGPGAKVASEQD